MEKADIYAVPFDIKKQYSAEAFSSYLVAFKNYDENKDGTIDRKELDNSKRTAIKLQSSRTLG